MSDLSPWQRPDGWPSDAYFDAVDKALAAAGVGVADGWRDEDWEFTFELAPESVHGWAALYISWRVDERDWGQTDGPEHADDFTGHGWYWVPYSDSQKALGDFAEDFTLAFLAEPHAVAQAVAELVSVTVSQDDKEATTS